jgi:hypothetical protein
MRSLINTNLVRLRVIKVHNYLDSSSLPGEIIA